jgi:hypothetical protein
VSKDGLHYGSFDHFQHDLGRCGYYWMVDGRATDVCDVRVWLMRRLLWSCPYHRQCTRLVLVILQGYRLYSKSLAGVIFSLG